MYQFRCKYSFILNLFKVNDSPSRYPTKNPTKRSFWGIRNKQSEWPQIFIESCSYSSMQPVTMPCDTDSEKEGFRIKSLASGCSGQFRHSLCHPIPLSITFSSVQCSVYKILCSWSTNSCDRESTNSCFIFLLNINLVTIIQLQKSSKHSESFYEHLLSDS